jgi:hypothetical protein
MIRRDGRVDLEVPASLEMAEEVLAIALEMHCSWRELLSGWLGFALDSQAAPPRAPRPNGEPR